MRLVKLFFVLIKKMFNNKNKVSLAQYKTYINTELKASYSLSYAKLIRRRRKNKIKTIKLNLIIKENI